MIWFNTGEVLDEMPLYGLERAMGESPILTHDGSVTAFRMLDDDNNVTHRGKLNNDDNCDNQLAALRFGVIDAGATQIEILHNNIWIQEIN